MYLYLASEALPESELMVELLISLFSLVSCSTTPPLGKSFLVGDVVIGLRLAAFAAIIAAKSAGPPLITAPPDRLEASGVA